MSTACTTESKIPSLNINPFEIRIGLSRNSFFFFQISNSLRELIHHLLTPVCGSGDQPTFPAHGMRGKNVMRGLLMPGSERAALINSKFVCGQNKECEKTPSCNILSERDGDGELGLQIPTGGSFLNIFWLLLMLSLQKYARKYVFQTHPDFAKQ